MATTVDETQVSPNGRIPNIDTWYTGEAWKWTALATWKKA
jgi:hypothetical protein